MEKLTLLDELVNIETNVHNNQIKQLATYVTATTAEIDKLQDRIDDLNELVDEIEEVATKSTLVPSDLDVFRGRVPNWGVTHIDGSTLTSWVNGNNISIGSLAVRN